VARVRAQLRRAVKVASAGADRLRPNVAGVVILIYHRVGAGSALEIDLGASLFDEQMATIAASGRAVPLATALEQLAGSELAPPRESSVVVTFDDGTADFADVAVPILVRHGIPATLYAATAFVDEGLEFPGGGLPVSWSGLRDACATGLVTVGSHTHRHLLLDRITPADAADELDRSAGLIAEHLGRPAVDFAYPKAVEGRPDVVRLVRERFRSAALAGTRVNPFASARSPRPADPYRLSRSPIQVSDGMEYFSRKLAGGMALEDTFRRAVNRARYAKISS
jgi:hypothetical protein